MARAIQPRRAGSARVVQPQAHPTLSRIADWSRGACLDTGWWRSGTARYGARSVPRTFGNLARMRASGSNAPVALAGMAGAPGKRHHLRLAPLRSGQLSLPSPHLPSRIFLSHVVTV